jgi:hypothetical protein
VIPNGNNLFSFRSALKYQWYVNDEKIIGANQRSYTHNGQPGSYYVVISNDTCSRSAEPVIITSVDDPFNNASVEVYPNPVSQTLNVSNLPGTIVNYALIDPLGRRVSQGATSDKSLQVSVSQLQRGLYLIVIWSESMKLSRRVVLH